MIQQALIWLIPLLLVGLMIWALIHENNRQRHRTVEEFERDLAKTKSSLLRAGMLELDKFVGNANEKRAAVEYLKDEEEGMTKTGGKGDDRDRTAGQE